MSDEITKEGEKPADPFGTGIELAERTAHALEQIARHLGTLTLLQLGTSQRIACSHAGCRRAAVTVSMTDRGTLGAACSEHPTPEVDDRPVTQGNYQNAQPPPPLDGG